MLEPDLLILHYMEGYSTKSSFFRLFGKSCDVREMSTLTKNKSLRAGVR